MLKFLNFYLSFCNILCYLISHALSSPVFLKTLPAGQNWPAEVSIWPAGDVSKMVENGKWPAEAKTCGPRR